jgi:hypothetical protein
MYLAVDLMLKQDLYIVQFAFPVDDQLNVI